MDNLNDFTKYCPPTSIDSMYCDIIRSDEIVKITRNFSNNKSPGLDGMTSKLLKEISTDIIQPLTLIFNPLFTNRMVPNYLNKKFSKADKPAR